MDTVEELAKKLKNASTDLEWFDNMCEILKCDNKPTTQKLVNILGTEKANSGNEIRGSKFIESFDKRFETIYLSPNISPGEEDRPLEYLGFSGNRFTLLSSEIAKRFLNYRVQINTYDGGFQFFFYPVPINFEFTALSFDVYDESAVIQNVKIETGIKFHNITFHFGDKMTLGRDGYLMRR